MSQRPDFIATVSREKLGMPIEWECYKWEKIGTTDDVLVTGGLPRLITRGPRKGRKTWDGAGAKVVVTQGEIEAAKLAYEAETNRCHRCGGDGQEWCGWSAAEGNRYKPCTRCNATGVAPSAPVLAEAAS